MSQSVQDAETGRRRSGRTPSADVCVFRNLIQKWARLQPDKVFAVLDAGAEVTFGQLQALAERTAAGLHDLGVRHGSRVVVQLPNGLDCLRVWLAINWLGAVYVPINTAFKGSILAHVLENADAELMIVAAELVPELERVERGAMKQVVVVGDFSGTVRELALLPDSVLDGDPSRLPALNPIAPWDVQSIVYTSGTTGNSKGVVSTYAHLYEMSGPDAFTMIEANDRYMVHLPLFHVGGTIPVMAMLVHGGSIALVPSFSTDKFWPRVRSTQSTIGVLLGVMATFLMKQAPSSDDRSHTFKKAIIIPLGDECEAFAQRFGCDVYTLYNMTEISTPLVSGTERMEKGACGKPRVGVDLRIVDENDQEVAAGTTGELIVRTDAAWALSSGYYRNPPATVAAWRNGWFHTGDAFRVEADGTYYFVDRLKDTIRRRGENISSFEVEVEVASHPSVREAAAIAVPSDFSEDEVMCVVSSAPGHAIDPAALLKYLEPRLPRFMLPRYIKVVDELPKTETGKIRKQQLRADGLTGDFWDKEKTTLSTRNN